MPPIYKRIQSSTQKVPRTHIKSMENTQLSSDTHKYIISFYIYTGTKGRRR